MAMIKIDCIIPQTSVQKYIPIVLRYVNCIPVQK